MPKEALPIFREVLAVAEAALRRGDFRLGLHYPAEAELATPLSRQQWVVSRFRRCAALPVRCSAGPKQLSDPFSGGSNLSFACLDLGLQAEAVKLQRELAEEFEELYGGADARTLNMRGSLVQALYLTNKSESRRLLGPTLVAAKRHLGLRHHVTLNLLALHSSLLDHEGKTEASIAVMRDLLAWRTEESGLLNQETLVVMSNLATVLYEKPGATMEDKAEAVSLFRKALAAKEEVLGPSHQSTLMTCFNLGKALGSMGALKESRLLLTRSGHLAEQSLGADHAQTRRAKANLAIVSELSLHCERPGCAYRGTTKLCSACKTVRYCSRDCQLACWDDHRMACKEARAVVEAGKDQTKR